MKTLFPAAALTVLCTLAPGARAAEAPVPGKGFTTATKENKVTPADLLQLFDAKEADYTLGTGDEIAVSVWNRPELSAKHVVGPDGRITLPYAGVMQVAGLTREAAVAAISKIYAPYYEDLNITLQVLRYDSNRIFILGRVANPGVLRYEGRISLLEAVTRAGGLPIGGIGADKAALARCVVFRGQDQMVWIDLRSVLNGSNLALNIHLRREDTLYIPDSDDQMVYVMGEVQRPGAVRVTPEMTFLSALAQAGGPKDDARTGKIRLVRTSEGIEREFNLKDFYRSGKTPNVTLQDGDVLYVPRSTLGNVGYVFQKLGPLTGWMMFGTAFKP